MNTIKMRIKELRMVLGLTQCQLAQRLGVTQSTVARWEVHERTPTSGALPLLAKTLGCSVDELYMHEPPEAV